MSKALLLSVSGLDTICSDLEYNLTKCVADRVRGGLGYSKLADTVSYGTQWSGGATTRIEGGSRVRERRERSYTSLRWQNKLRSDGVFQSSHIREVNCCPSVDNKWLQKKTGENGSVSGDRRQQVIHSRPIGFKDLLKKSFHVIDVVFGPIDRVSDE